MPLITMCGLPLSGKSTRSKELANFLETYIAQQGDTLTKASGISFRPKVVVVSDESVGTDKRSAYADSNEEKKARGALLSAVERFLSKDVVVICDGLNYIKGFRYQLYCVARGLGTPACTIHCGIPMDTVRRRYTEMSSSGTMYDSHVFENMCSRFEEPDGRNRWDTPLFTVLPEDPAMDTGCNGNSDTAVNPLSDASNQPDQQTETHGALPLSHNPVAIQIAESLLLRRPPAPNLSTVVKPLTDTNYLHEMDKTTSTIADIVVESQRNGLMGRVAIPHLSRVALQLPSRTVSLAELRKWRRQFTNINKLHTMIDMKLVADAFVEYLNTNLA